MSERIETREDDMEPRARVFERDETFAGWDDDYYTPVTKRFYDEMIAAMLAALRLSPGDVVLDAGCGPGVHAIRAAAAGVRVDAVDLSGTALREASRRVERAGVSASVTLQQADLTALPFANGAYRAIFSWGVLIHIPQAERAIAELARVLAPGGRLALYVCNESAIDRKLERFGRLALGRARPSEDRLELGVRRWYKLHGEDLCVWGFDMAALTRHVAELGLVRVLRRAGELTEIQRRVRGPLRRLLQHLNNAYAHGGLPPALAASNLLVFEKRGAAA